MNDARPDRHRATGRALLVVAVVCIAAAGGSDDQNRNERDDPSIHQGLLGDRVRGSIDGVGIIVFVFGYHKEGIDCNQNLPKAK